MVIVIFVGVFGRVLFVFRGKYVSKMVLFIFAGKFFFCV